MEIKDWIYIITGIISIVGSYFSLKNEIRLVEKDLENIRQNYDKLEKIEGKIDEVKDMIIALKK